MAEALVKCLTHIKESGENTDEDLIREIYKDIDILFCEAITDAGIAEDPLKILEPLKQFYAEMQNKKVSFETESHIQIEQSDQNISNIAQDGEVSQEILPNLSEIPPIDLTENDQAALEIWDELKMPSGQSLITNFIKPKAADHDSALKIDETLSTPVEKSANFSSKPSNAETNESEIHSLRSEFIAFKNAFNKKSKNLESKINVINTKLEKEFWTSGEVKNQFDLREFPDEFFDMSISFSVGKSHSLTSDIFAILEFLDEANSIELRKTWWQNNVNSKRLSIGKIAFLAKHCLSIIIFLGQMWVENISAISIEKIYMKILALTNILRKLKFEEWPKFKEIEKSLTKVANSENITQLSKSLSVFNLYGLKFSLLIHDQEHWKNFETKSLASIDSWDKIRFRVNLAGFEEPYVNIFPEEGEQHLEELDSRMSGLGLSQIQEDEQDSTQNSDNEQLNSDSSESSQDESPPSKKKKSNYIEPSFSKFWDELKKLAN